MNETRSFYPIYKPYSAMAAGQVSENIPSVTVAASNGVAVASIVFPGTLENNYVQIQIANKTSVWVHVNFGVLNGASSTTVRAATINDYPVGPGSVVVVSVDPEVNASSVFADGAPAASTSVVFSRGEGI